MTRICPHCGEPYQSGAGLSSHARTCQKRPARAKLEAMVKENVSLDEMAYRSGVHYTTIRNWLEDIDQGDYRLHANGTEKEPLDLVKEQAPLFGQVGGCAGCPGLSECHDRLMAGLWVLCEAPEERDVIAAEMAGLIEIARKTPSFKGEI